MWIIVTESRWRFTIPDSYPDSTKQEKPTPTLIKACVSLSLVGVVHVATGVSFLIEKFEPTTSFLPFLLISPLSQSYNSNPYLI